MRIRARTMTAIIATLLMATVTVAASPTSNAASPMERPSKGTQTIGGLTLPTSKGRPTPQEAEQIAKAAYVYGFPLVTMNATKAQLTNVPAAETFSAPVNQFNTPSTPVTPAFTAVPAAPVDVLFSNAWLDLSKEPLVFTMPNTNGVYNQMTILSGWTNVLAAPGKRTTGTGGGNFLIAGPCWRGKVPAGMTLISSPTNLVWIEGSTQYDGPSSLATVNAIQAGYKLTPLSAWGTSYTPPTNVPTDPNVDTSSTPQSQVQNMSPQEFFTELAALMVANPPSRADKPVVKQMARIGIVPGKPFRWNKLDRRHSGSDHPGRQRGAPQRHRTRFASPWVNERERLAGQPRTRLGKLRHRLLAAGCRRVLGVGRGAAAGRHVLRRRRRREPQQLHDHVPGGPDAADECHVGHRHVQLTTPPGEQPDRSLRDRTASGSRELQRGRVTHRLCPEHRTQHRSAAAELAAGPRWRLPAGSACLLAAGAGAQRHLVAACPGEGKLTASTERCRATPTAGSVTFAVGTGAEMVVSAPVRRSWVARAAHWPGISANRPA